MNKYQQELMDMLTEGSSDPQLTQALMVELINEFGGQIDGCSICGSIPMNTNCNNAGCDSV